MKVAHCSTLCIVFCLAMIFDVEDMFVRMVRMVI